MSALADTEAKREATNAKHTGKSFRKRHKLK